MSKCPNCSAELLECKNPYPVCSTPWPHFHCPNFCPVVLKPDSNKSFSCYHYCPKCSPRFETLEEENKQLKEFHKTLQDTLLWVYVSLTDAANITPDYIAKNYYIGLVKGMIRRANFTHSHFIIHNELKEKE